LKRKFLTNLSLLVFLNLLIKPFWFFGIDRNVQNIVGTGEYGFYFSLLSFSFLFNIILDLGITNFNNRDVSKNPALFREYFSNIIIVKLLLAVLYGIVSISAAILLGYGKHQLGLLSVLIINQFLSSFILYLRSNVSGLQLYTTDSLLSVLDRSIMIILCSLAIWGHVLNTRFTIGNYVCIQTLSYLVTILFITTVLWAKSGSWAFSFHPGKALQFLRQCLPFALLGLLMSFYNRFDSIMLERILPDGRIDAGIYAQSYRILEASSNFSFLFATLLLPMFSRMLGSNDDVMPLVRTAFNVMFVVSVAFSLCCFFYHKPIIQILYHGGNDYSASVFSLVILSFIPVSLSYIFGTLLTANGNLRHLNYIALAGVLVNMSLNLVLIPRYKAIGAAVASLVTQTIVTMVQVIMCMRIWNVNPGMPGILKFLLFVFLSIGVVIGSIYVPVPWVLSFTGAGLLICLLSLLIGILSVKNIIEAIKLQLRRMVP
jgi:O-antigen/teichoic acid export membrane protein